MIVVCGVSIWSTLSFMQSEPGPVDPAGVVAQDVPKADEAVLVLLAAEEPGTPISEVYPQTVGTTPEAPPTVARRPRLARLTARCSVI